MCNNSTTKAVLLGLAQDAGVPQIGCDCINCHTVKGKEGWPVSLGLVDDQTKKFWIIDATPKFAEQYNWLSQHYNGYKFCGILLTHAHIGHYTGLMYLGREAMNGKSIPVYASGSMQKFLCENSPWSQLIDIENIQLLTFKAEQDLPLSDALTIKPVSVIHRSEFTDTFAFLVFGNSNKLFYCPDIDHWQGLDPDKYLGKNDVALLDGTFFSHDELPGRDLSKIPHPLVTETVEFVKTRTFATWLIHLNHSNPLWRAGQKTNRLLTDNIKLPNFGQVWRL